MPPGPGLWQMTDVSGPLFRNAQLDHFVIRPERAVDHQTIRFFEERPDLRFDLAETRRVEEHLSAARDPRSASRCYPRP